MEETKETTVREEKADKAPPAPSEKSKWIRRALPYGLPPVFVMAIMLVCFFMNRLYPFGVGTVAWCDMTQQVVPLLCDLKDILTFKTGLFLNLQNAGGMNMWAVIFFFVASPFSLLVVFVDKADMIWFANILVMLKLMTCALTAVIYFKKRLPRLGNAWSGIFAVAYALSGYAMMYYQNCIWLDMMYLFPLLLVAFGELTDKRRLRPYVIVMALMMVVNYYIGYMVVVYTLLFMGIFCFRNRKEERYSYAAADFIAGSFLAALVSAVVWIPSFMLYLTSGRRESFIDTLAATGFYARYQTTLPTVMHSVLTIVILAICLCDGRRRDRRTNTYLIMCVLMLVPLYLEPINIMWHTGSYMSFPSRYGFMTQFVLIIAAARMLSDTEARPVSPPKSDKGWVLCVVGVLLFFVTRFSMNFVTDNIEKIGAYASSLWGDDKSFHLIIKLMIFLGASYALFYVLYRKGLLTRELFTLICAILVVIEGYNNIAIYMTPPDNNYPERATDQRLVMDLAGRVDDEMFYRVKTQAKNFDVNLVGAMGYPSISHYTSLTSEDYMFMMKRLGYSSYWMEVGSYGGTELTDALMSVQYRIVKGAPTNTSVYANEKYSFEYYDYYLPLGLAVPESASEAGLEGLDRAQIQEFVFENTLAKDGEKLIVGYSPDEEYEGLSGESGRFALNKGTDIVYSVHVTGRQSLYFDCFDKLSNALKEEINDSFSVTVNGSVKDGSYPNKNMNGVLYLGTFEDEDVIISADCLKSITCSSFGVFGVDLGQLERSMDQARTVGFEMHRGTLEGSINAAAGEKCLVSVPWSESLKIKVNGKRVDYRRMFDDMVVFDLEPGDNEIKITGSGAGLIPGLLVSVIGIVLCILYKRFHSRIKYSGAVRKAAWFLVVIAGYAVFALIYLLPVAINMGYRKGI